MWQNLHLSKLDRKRVKFLTKESSSINELFELEQPKEPPSWRVIRGRLWLEHAVWMSGLSSKQFDREHIQRDRSASNLMIKWRSGKSAPSRASAVALERRIPNTLWLFDLPLFPLLENRPISRANLCRAIAPWRFEVPSEPGHDKDTALNAFFRHPRWQLPPDAGGNTIYNEYSYESLAYRGDIFGLAGIVAIMRYREIRKNHVGHEVASEYSFRSLPSLLRLPWCAAHVRDIFDTLTILQHRVDYSAQCFIANWDVIAALARRRTYEPAPTRRKNSGRRDIYRMYPDPITPLNPVPYKDKMRW
jgi:hypothetical protein